MKNLRIVLSALILFVLLTGCLASIPIKISGEPESPIFTFSKRRMPFFEVQAYSSLKKQWITVWSIVYDCPNENVDDDCGGNVIEEVRFGEVPKGYKEEVKKPLKPWASYNAGFSYPGGFCHGEFYVGDSNGKMIFKLTNFENRDILQMMSDYK
ncbi:MAG: hypothetical protein CVV21_09755 [Candidatus Goldiibacteriota bacterium HGW-Goldbacteria-1]|nr:MAG: hypothetical protein CVV21_09755 [Candidatus Goldiibacteriota bacterium HGW-Goldbacteria-1]